MKKITNAPEKVRRARQLWARLPVREDLRTSPSLIRCVDLDNAIEEQDVDGRHVRWIDDVDVFPRDKPKDVKDALRLMEQRLPSRRRCDDPNCDRARACWHAMKTHEYLGLFPAPIVFLPMEISPAQIERFREQRGQNTWSAFQWSDLGPHPTEPEPVTHVEPWNREERRRIQARRRQAKIANFQPR